MCHCNDLQHLLVPANIVYENCHTQMPIVLFSKHGNDCSNSTDWAVTNALLLGVDTT